MFNSITQCEAGTFVGGSSSRICSSSSGNTNRSNSWSRSNSSSSTGNSSGDKFNSCSRCSISISSGSSNCSNSILAVVIVVVGVVVILAVVMVAVVVIAILAAISLNGDFLVPTQIPVKHLVRWSYSSWIQIGRNVHLYWRKACVWDLEFCMAVSSHAAALLSAPCCVKPEETMTKKKDVLG